MPLVPPVGLVATIADEECRHSSSFPRMCGAQNRSAVLLVGGAQELIQGWAKAHRTRRGISRDAVRPTGPVFGRPDDKLCPRGSSSPFDSVGKTAGANMQDPPLRHAVLPTW